MTATGCCRSPRRPPFAPLAGGGGVAHIVFDIGGSKTRAALVERRTRALLAVAVTATPNHLDLPDASFDDLRRRLLSAMQRIAREVAGAAAVQRVDVAFAGPL